MYREVPTRVLLAAVLEVQDLIDDHPTVVEMAKHFRTTQQAIRDAIDDNNSELEPNEYLDLIVAYKTGSGMYELPLREQQVEAYCQPLPMP